MISALLLIFDPVGTWERIIRAQRSVTFILCIQLLPLLILAGAAEGFRLARPQGWSVVGLDGFQVRRALVFEAAQALALLIMVLAASQAVRGMGETFNAQKTFRQALTVVAYGLSPAFLLRFVLVFPGIEPRIPWVWMVGVSLCLAGLYHGVPRVMTPDPSHAFGFFLATTLILLLATGAIYVPAFLYQHRRFALG